MASTSRAPASKGGKPKDPCWKHGIPGSGRGMVICIHCEKEMNGGINRLKYHLARVACHDVTGCTEATAEVQNEARALLVEFEQKKEARKRTAEAMGAIGRESRDTVASSSCLGPRIRGVSKVGSDVSNFFVPRNTPGSQPSLEGTSWNKELQHEAKLACARFWYYNSIPFNVASSPYWKELVTALTVVGKGFKAPSNYELSGPLLEDEVQNTYKLVEQQKEIWKSKGCSILSDGWTDGRNRTLINFLVASGGQLVFLRSVDASSQSKTAETLCSMLDEVVMEVGVDNVIQIITDNASAYVAAGKLLEARHPTMFWSPCAAHCLDLLLEDIGKLSWVKNVVEEGRNITKYIYNHTWVLNLMREYTNGKELVRSGVTRFATNFLTLQSIATTLPNLVRMFVSEKWLESPYCKKAEAQRVVKTIFDHTFAKSLDEIIKVSESLVRVLRMVDGDKNPMGYLYEAMDKAKEAIQHLYGSNRTKYEPIWRIIDRRWNRQLHRHIHAAAYYLNPKFFFSSSFRPAAEVMHGLHTCIDRMLPNDELRDLIHDELQMYKRAEGVLFSTPTCIRRRDTLQPDLWWEDFGASTPNLQNLAIRILSQPCSASGCKRNWSVFESIHTKKRNRLTQKRLNDLVFVRYNLRLHEKKVQGADSYGPLDLDEIDPYSDWIGEDVDTSLLTNDEIADLEREDAEWQANVAAYEDSEGESSKSSGGDSEDTETGPMAEVPVEAPIEAPVEEPIAIPSTSTAPTQRQHTFLSFSRRRNL